MLLLTTISLSDYLDLTCFILIWPLNYYKSVYVVNDVLLILKVNAALKTVLLCYNIARNSKLTLGVAVSTAIDPAAVRITERRATGQCLLVGEFNLNYTDTESSTKALLF